MRRILVTRTDRLGDVVLATPVIRRLRALHPEAQIDFLVRPEWAPVLRFPHPVRVRLYDPDLSASALARQFREERYDVAYVLRDEARVSVAVARSGIPLRVGPYSSLRSFFVFNRGVLQRRSRCLKHEAEYNLDLVGGTDSGPPRAWVETSEQAKAKASAFLSGRGFQSKQYVVLHPGSSGSARYLKQELLHEFARRILSKGIPLILSGGPAEEQLLREFQAQVPGVCLLGGSTGPGLDVLAEVLRGAKAVIAHGTGPLHLAAAVGTPVLAIFPPLFVLSEKRWGPLVDRRSVWMPPVDCPEKFRCAGSACPVYDCMDLFNVESALQTLETLIT
jgi:ADP-heptose:LPS heptosyltransferase